ncbi:MAG: peptide chain release factor N(5)-glutamine methyltransferase [Chloroflexi bacterium]|nr:peptide chain release factor N(5)-glutamine methyltransferase [Chloroflexota bacterium]
MTTVAAALDGAVARLAGAGVDTPRLDAEVLLGHVLGVARTGVLAHPEAPLGDGQVVAYRDLIEQRAAGQPVAYLRGLREFHGIALAVDARVLIPRPETELLVDLGLADLRVRLTGAPRPPDAPALRAWDVGTGSGAIAVALAVALRAGGYLPEVRIAATDISSDALTLAIENAVAHGVADRVDLAPGDLLDAPVPQPVELLLANLPYIASAEVATLPAEVRAEPRLALDGGADGLELLARLVRGLPTAVAPGGLVLLEVGAGQAPAVEALVTASLPGWSVRHHVDLAGHARVVAIDVPR